MIALVNVAFYFQRTAFPPASDLAIQVAKSQA